MHILIHYQVFIDDDLTTKNYFYLRLVDIKTFLIWKKKKQYFFCVIIRNNEPATFFFIENLHEISEFQPRSRHIIITLTEKLYFTAFSFIKPHQKAM